MLLFRCSCTIRSRTLMKRLREVLRNEYIGAIAIGFLLFQAVSDLIAAVMQPLVTYIQNHNRPQSVFAAPPSIFDWPRLTLSLVDVVLHLLVVFLLILWLYRTPKPKPAPGVSPEKPQTQP